MKQMTVAQLHIDAIDQITELTQVLNPNKSSALLKQRQRAMFDFENYYCFGLYEAEKLIGVASGWLTVRLYSGKQLEVDNVIVQPSGQGCGTYFLQQIEQWAEAEACCTVELNTYVENRRSHKFYFKEGYKILGFHFQKKLR